MLNKAEIIEARYIQDQLNIEHERLVAVHHAIDPKGCDVISPHECLCAFDSVFGEYLLNPRCDSIIKRVRALVKDYSEILKASEERLDNA